MLATHHRIGDDDLDFLRQGKLRVLAVVHFGVNLLEPFLRRLRASLRIPGVPLSPSKKVHPGQNLDGQFAGLRVLNRQFLGPVVSDFLSAILFGDGRQVSHIADGSGDLDRGSRRFAVAHIGGPDRAAILTDGSYKILSVFLNIAADRVLGAGDDANAILWTARDVNLANRGSTTASCKYALAVELDFSRDSQPGQPTNRRSLADPDAPDEGHLVFPPEQEVRVANKFFFIHVNLTDEDAVDFRVFA